MRPRWDREVVIVFRACIRDEVQLHGVLRAALLEESNGPVKVLAGEGDLLLCTINPDVERVEVVVMVYYVNATARGVETPLEQDEHGHPGQDAADGHR